MRILLAEDERDLNRIITKKLTSEGYSVDGCFDGREALVFLTSAEYDAAVLDIMMPGMDGLSVLRTLRGAGNATPVLFLTARDSIADRVKGLDLGANDYLVKPFSFDELTARIRAMIRTAHGSARSELIVGDLVMDCALGRVTRGGQEIVLSAKEYALLEYLMLNANLVLSREKIENHIWNFDYEGGTNVVDVYISYLRRKIDDGHEDKLIHTVRGRGYVLRERSSLP
ncbi:MAG: response regulator transcription factor [Lachnospiraceae bacterium]|nr:response regulator transcription factor [Lachnospiraceae bacterium]